MSTQEQSKCLPPHGTLDLLIFRNLVFDRQGGQGLARAIRATSEGAERVDYPASCRFFPRREGRGAIAAARGGSSNSPRARFYVLAKTGRNLLISPTTRWRLAVAVGRVPAPEILEG